jgi:hypothetical protein
MLNWKTGRSSRKMLPVPKAVELASPPPRRFIRLRLIWREAILHPNRETSTKACIQGVRGQFHRALVCTVVYEWRPEVKLRGDSKLLIGVYSSPDACSPRPPVRQAAVTVDKAGQTGRSPAFNDAATSSRW